MEASSRGQSVRYFSAARLEKVNDKTYQQQDDDATMGDTERK